MYVYSVLSSLIVLVYQWFGVTEPPVIIPDLSSPHRVTAKEGDTIQLVCNVTGVPAPTVTWYKKSSFSRHHSSMEGGIFWPWAENIISIFIIHCQDNNFSIIISSSLHLFCLFQSNVFQAIQTYLRRKPVIKYPRKENKQSKKIPMYMWCFAWLCYSHRLWRDGAADQEH